MQAPETRRGQRRRGRALSSQSSMKGIFLSAVTTDPAGAPAERKTDADRPADAALGEPGEAPLPLMALHAHPDDESSKGAATMAPYARGGVDVIVCTLTWGVSRDILKKPMSGAENRPHPPAVTPPD